MQEEQNLPTIESRETRDDKRLTDLKSVIEAYIKAEKIIPVEWIGEYAQLTRAKLEKQLNYLYSFEYTNTYSNKS